MRVAKQSFDDLACRLATLVSGVDPRADRLSEARTTAAITSSDGIRQPMVLVFDRSPCEIRREQTDAEIDIVMHNEDAERLLRGTASLQILIMEGRATFRGPVRKLLSIGPVMRMLLRDTCDPDDAPAFADAPAPRTLDTIIEPDPGDFWSLECRGVAKALGGRVVLRDVTVGFPEGMITVVLGPSGTGKSVLLKHLIGLMRPDDGEVRVRGASISDMRLSDLLELRKRYGVLFQDGALWASLNLFDNVALPLRQHTDLNEAEIARVVGAALAEVGLAGAEERMPGELSGGMRKRAGFARALVLDPEIVLFDEPDSGLDPVRTALLAEIISGTHAERGGTYIVITHDIDAARRIADYVVVLWDGVVHAAGPASAVFGSHEPFLEQFMSGGTRGPLGFD